MQHFVKVQKENAEGTYLTWVWCYCVIPYLKLLPQSYVMRGFLFWSHPERDRVFIATQVYVKIFHFSLK